MLLPVAFLVGLLLSLPNQTPAHHRRGVADEPGVAEILGRPGLAGCRPAGNRPRVLPVPVAIVSGEHRVHHRHMGGMDDLPHAGTGLRS